MVGQIYKLRFILEQAVNDQKGSVVNSPFLHPWVVNATPRPLYPQEAGWTPGPVSMRACGKPGVHRDSIPGPFNA